MFFFSLVSREQCVIPSYCKLTKMFCKEFLSNNTMITMILNVLNDRSTTKINNNLFKWSHDFKKVSIFVYMYL